MVRPVRVEVLRRVRASERAAPAATRSSPDVPAEAALTIEAMAGLQRSAGNQAVGRMIEQHGHAGRVLQRMAVTTQNKAEVDALKQRYLAANPGDFEGWSQMVKDALGMPDLRAAVVAAAPEQQQASAIPFGDRDREGGMAETDAARLAEHYEWEVATASSWNCPADRAHTPKGRVYTDGRGNYWGADNTGHVGFGFKYWTGSPRALVYMGNVRHHSPFAIVQRGSQRTEKKGKGK
jgi:hypothetical protein